MKWLLVLVSCALLSSWAVVKADDWTVVKADKAVVKAEVRASDAVDWCYHLPSCNYTRWPTIAPSHCNGTRQSPINIVSASATGDSNLGAFTFTKFDSNMSLINISNTGKTIKVGLGSGVKIAGGGLADPYDSLQFHLHWGNGSSVGGSEHTVDGHRYPMELHIVNSKASYNGDTGHAIQDSTGLAALGFFIEAMSGDATASPASWNTLTTYLSSVTQKGQEVPITAARLSLDDLLSGVDRTKYYRYLGSLTTPTCNEAVVWTVFKETIKVSKDLIDLFSTKLHVADSTSQLMTLTFRGVQPAQPVTTQLATSGSSKTCFSLGLMALCLLIWSA